MNISIKSFSDLDARIRCEHRRNGIRPILQKAGQWSASLHPYLDHILAHRYFCDGGPVMISSRVFSCSFDQSKRAYHRSLNAVFGKLGRFAAR
jgi:hypothetical protein